MLDLPTQQVRSQSHASGAVWKSANRWEPGQRFIYLTDGGADNLLAAIWLASIYTGFTWAVDAAPQGCVRSAVQGQECRGRLWPPCSAAIPAQRQ